jgi:hypothetical protein
MAFYLNPRGIVLPPSAARKIGVPLDTRWIVGTKGDDVFTFTKLYNHVVISLGGKATYNGAATMAEPDMAIYYSYPLKASWDLLKPYLKLPAWHPGTAKQQIGQIGGGMELKGDGHKMLVLHGGHYITPTKAWMQPGDRVHMADDKLGWDDIDEFRFHGARPDFDGKGKTALLDSADLRGQDHSNPITDGQKLSAKFNDSGHYTDFKATWVDWDHSGGPTKLDVWHAIDGYFM